MAEFANQDLRTVSLSNQKSVYVGSSAPGTAHEGQHWVDISTDPPVLKIYDLTNTAWMTQHPIFYETVTSGQEPAVTPVSEGTLVVAYDTEQSSTTLFAYSNSLWVNLDTAASPSLTGDAVVGEVKTGSTFYKDDYTKLTGDGTQTLSAANETVSAGYYAETTLSTVDADLAAVNIKKDEAIFGFTGTYKGDPAGDAEESAKITVGTVNISGHTTSTNLISGVEVTLLQVNITPSVSGATICAFGGGQFHGDANINTLLYIDSTLVDMISGGATIGYSLKGYSDEMEDAQATIYLKAKIYSAHSGAALLTWGTAVAGISVVT